MEDNAKFYGLCLMRLRHQIALAKERSGAGGTGPVILESYNTGEIDEIVDILEIYDLTDATRETLDMKLDELAYTASVLTREKIGFTYDARGHLVICVTLRPAATLQTARAA